MLDKERIALAKYRIEKAKASLKVSKLAIDEGYYSDSANRSYYAVFYAINALFSLSGKSFKKHTGVITNFGLDYIQTGIIEPEYGHIANLAFRVRTKTDYSDFYVVSKEDVLKQYENAVKFVDRIEKYLLSQTDNS
ncbi:MAG: HEPN domain-containing protein [Ruminococcaceae bacterium]|nr:HEPN domain-containing protein [Oscillospiraceae bacterium]